jgi:hypothetical protein
MGERGTHRPALGRSRIAILALISALATAGAPSKAPPRCAGPEFHEFDFWKGDWDAYDIADTTKIVGRGQVTSILDGCVLREVYRQNDGLEGESYNLWDAKRRLWHQSWVTNRGDLLLLDGLFEDNRMTLIGRETRPDGSSSLLRGIWWPEGTNVREKADRSTDGGKSWTPVFDMVFRPHRVQEAMSGNRLAMSSER